MISVPIIFLSTMALVVVIQWVLIYCDINGGDYTPFAFFVVGCLLSSTITLAGFQEHLDQQANTRADDIEQVKEDNG